MIQRIAHQLTREDHPNRLLSSLAAGLVTGALTIILEISFATLIFSGDLSGYVARGIGLTLFSAFVIGIVVALTSSLAGVVANPQGNLAAILALMAAAIAGSMPASATAEDTFLTIVAAIGVTSFLTGAFLLALGAFRLGDLAQYIPYPVIGGFMAGTGWLLVRQAIGVMTEPSPSFSPLPTLFQPGVLVRWLPGFIFAVLLVVLLRRYKHFLILPAMLLAAIGLFYLLLKLTGLSVAEARSQGWLLRSFPAGALWRSPSLSALAQVNWPVILRQIGNIGTIMIISLIALLLRVSSLELAARRDIDLNRELRSAGVANLVAGIGGGPAGYHSLSLSTLGQKLGSTSRLVGLFSALLCGAVLVLNVPVVSLLPKPVLGGLLLFLGLGFLIQWVYDARSKLSKADYLIVLLILLIINAVGVLQGVGLGMVLALILFVVDYSRINVVKHTLSGTSYRSNVDRPRLYDRYLRTKGHWLYILELQGFIFFGTANRLLDQVHQRINASDLPSPHFIVMDFRQVSGLDASATFSFAKMERLAQAHNVALVFTHLSHKMRRQLEREVFKGEDDTTWHTFDDLDHGVEWCEEQIIQTLDDEDPHEAQPESISVEPLMQYMERKDIDEGYYLMRQGDPPKGIYFIEEGQVTVQLEVDDDRTMRLRTMGAGTIVGELGLYLGNPASASVVADRPGTVTYLSADNLERMEKDDPETAADFHKFVAHILSERLLNVTDTLQALMR